MIGGVLALLVANWLPHVAVQPDPRVELSAMTHDPARPLTEMASPFLCFTVVLMVSFVVQSLQFEKPGRTMAKIAGTLLVVAYVGLLGSFTVQLRWFEGRLQGIVALVFLVSTAKGADTGAYTMGRLAGRHKLWPSSESQEDGRRSAGRPVLRRLGRARRSPRSPASSSRFQPSIGRVAAVYGLVIGAVAQLGDLMESMIKRDCERKDASTAVPGFGGVLDVIDSLIFAGPVAYLFWLWFGP